jgi:uncharacterized protein YbjT (DUF2867 family)
MEGKVVRFVGLGYASVYLVERPAPDDFLGEAKPELMRATLIPLVPKEKIMKIVIAGGTGLIGRKLVSLLSNRFHEVVVASPSAGVNSITGVGLEKAFEGADVVVDVTNPPTFDPAAVMDFFTTSTKNLLSAGKNAGVTHHVVLSIVGTDSLPQNGYFVAKVAQEKLVQESGIPYSIVRATQFMEFMGTIADGATADGEVRLSTANFQPIAADDLAELLADVAAYFPLNRIVDAAGPDRGRMCDLIGGYLASIGDTRIVKADPEAGYFGCPLDENSLVPLGDRRIGSLNIEKWSQRPKAAA